MATVKYAISDYIADGTTTDYLITWDYLDEDHIAVYVDGTSNADPQADHTFTKLNATTLRVTDGVGGAIVAGSAIEIRRETPLTTRAITFADGSALLAEDLNKNSDYLLYSMQEVLDTVDAAAQDGALAAEVATQALRDEAEDLKDETLVARDTTQTYLATVQSDATDADNHRIAAGASEAAALSSETAAAASEAASAASEAASATSETNAATSAAASLASEQAAAASEVASAASEVAAAASEAAAASSEVNAEAAWDSLDDRYLGAKATAPTVDNDGDALQTGALYWNSTSDSMYVWNGSSWDTFNSTTGIADGASSTAVTIAPSGDVGIGEPTPSSKLHIAQTSDDFSGGIQIRNTADNNSVFIYQNGNVTTFDSGSSGDQLFRTGSSDALRITSDGKVGVRVDPVEALHVQDSRTASDTQGIRNSTYRPHLTLEDLSASVNDWQIWADSGELSFRYGDVSSQSKLGSVAMNIDSSGRVTKPYNPFFNVYHPAQGTADAAIRWQSIRHNIGGHYNNTNGVFTVPIDGVYAFHANVLIRYESPYYHRIEFRINGGLSNTYGDTLENQAGSSYSSPSLSGIFWLSSGDTVQIWNGPTETYGTGYGAFSGALIS
jgi:hypothetical protein